MRDFRDAKAMARSARAALAAKGLKISVGESLELIAKAFGVADWNALSAQVQAATQAGAAPPTPPAGARAPTSERDSFSANLEATLQRAVAAARERKHDYTTLEHLLLALIDDPDAAGVISASEVDPATLRQTLTRYLDHDLASLVVESAGEPKPTAGLVRVVQRAVREALIHQNLAAYPDPKDYVAAVRAIGGIAPRASGRNATTGAHVLVALFSEIESHAVFFLDGQGMTWRKARKFSGLGEPKASGDAAA